METISGYRNTNRGLLNSAEFRSSVYLHTENTGQDLMDTRQDTNVLPRQPIHKNLRSK